MGVYQYIVLLHVIGSFGIFTGWGMEISAIQRLILVNKASELKECLRVYRRASQVSMISMVVTFTAGIYLMVKAWGPEPWIALGILTLLFLIVVGMFFSRRALPVLKTMAQAEFFYMPVYLIRVRYLIVSICIRLSCGVMILALMVLKPAVAGAAILLLILVSLITLIAFLPLGKKTMQ